MPRIPVLRCLALFGLAGLAQVHAAHAMTPVLDWKPLPAIPDREGFAGSYAGSHHEALLVAGGANFPDKRPWEGGTKIWYDRVFVLEPDTASWRETGKLPMPGGYGVSVNIPDGVIVIGGGDAKRNFNEVWLWRWDGKAVSFTPWPRLPKPLAMAAGALVGKTIYVAGGLDKPDATKAQSAFFAIDIDQLSAGWRELPTWPGAERMLATAGSYGGAFYLFSGAKLVADAQGKTSREWLKDAYRYTPEGGWKKLADLPRVSVAAPSPAPEAGGKLLVIGGDDGAQVSVAPTDHKGFPRGVQAYDPVSNTWTPVGEVPFSLVTTTLTMWRGQVVVPGGEQRPGIRSTEAWAAKITVK